jgi:hypothetical protein
MGEMQPLWASGPSEILQHGLSILGKDTDANRRIAMILFDNAVEIAMQTYVGLPKRVTGLSIDAKQKQEICRDFHSLVSFFERKPVLSDAGVNLGEIEWLHGLRNTLYHNGNGLTVERSKVEFYGEVGRILIGALFGQPVTVDPQRPSHSMGDFLDAWAIVDAALRNAARRKAFTSGKAILEFLKKVVLSEREYQEFERLQEIRNHIAHSPESEGLVTHEVAMSARIIADRLHGVFPGGAT